jgi:uncharacterized protein
MRLFNILSLVCVVFSLCLPTAHAEEESPPACHGRDLWSELKQTDPAGYAQVEKAAAATMNSGSLYWKIMPPNGAKPSYLLGTMHVTDSRVAVPSKTLRERIAKSKVAVFELANVGNRQSMSGEVFRDVARTQMPDGQSLWDLIPDDREAAFRSHPALAQMPPDALARLQPWLLISVLSSPPCEEVRKNFKFVLDAALYQSAQISSVDIEGLETMTEQLDVFSSFSLADQAAMLLDQTGGSTSAEDNLETMVGLYLNKQITVMTPLMQYLGKKNGIHAKPRDEKFMKNLLGTRNVNMAERSKRYLDKGAAFIAVGALHLYGEDGVVALLQKAGYKVTAED